MADLSADRQHIQTWFIDKIVAAPITGPGTRACKGRSD